MRQGDVTTQAESLILPIRGFTIVAVRDMTLAAGTQTIILGFKPSLVICLSAEAVNGDTFSVGFGDTIQNINVGISQDEDGNTAGEIEFIAARQSSPTGTYLGKITSTNATSFTITWTKSGSPIGTFSLRFAAWK